MANISTDMLYKAYLAYFGRPPDLTGLAFFSNKTEAEVVAAFSASPESQVLLASQGSIPAQVNAIYLNLFNRPAEFNGPGSASHWVIEITQGRLTTAQAAMEILKSAIGTDAQTVQAKYNASVAFVIALDTAAEVSGYAGLEAAQDAREFLATVDYQNIPTQAQVDAAVLKATTPNVKYEVAASAAQVNEGQTVVFTISTTNVAEGTLLSYAITGINAADLQSGLITGTVNVDKSGQALVQVTLKADLTTEGLETMTLTVGENLASASVNVLDTSVTPPPPPVPTYTVTPSAGSVSEGQTLVFTINTTNVPEGTLLSYEITGINAADLVSGMITGQVLIDQYGKALVQLTLKNDLTTEGDEVLTFNLSDGLDSVNVTVVDTSVTPPPPPVENLTLVATTGIDVLNGGAGNDTFIATNATLQNGDQFNGKEGTDQLDIRISGNSGSYFDGFQTNSVEIIRVNNLSTSPVDFSMAGLAFIPTELDADGVIVPGTGVYVAKDGKVTLASEGALGEVSFKDIQSISSTNLSVKDTALTTNFYYDTGNSAAMGYDNGASGQEGDVANLTVSEMRGTTYQERFNWYMTEKNWWGGANSTDAGRPYGVHGAQVNLYNGDPEGPIESYVDRIVLNSNVTGQVSMTSKNTMQLHAGEDLDHLIIKGAADLEITNTLDANIRLVDASAHRDPVKPGTTESLDSRADLILDLSNSSDGVLFADQNAWWTDDANGDGYVSGDLEDQRSGIVETLTIIGSQGDDLITTGTTHNDKKISLGTGNDTIVAAGWIPSGGSSAAVISEEPSRHPEFSILWGGEATVDGGAGNDVIVTGNLNDSVIAGDGDDIVIDGGSTSANTRNTNYFHGEKLSRYAPDFVQDGNWFDLGKGNDQLTVESALNLLGDSANLTERQIVSGSNDTVWAGEGNDVVTIKGSAIDGYIQANQGNIWDRVDTHVNLGDGNDRLSVGDSGSRTGYRTFGELEVNYSDKAAGQRTIDAWGGSRGDVSVEGGLGNDTITIWRDGTQTVNSGAGNDSVAIHQDENEFSPNHWDGSAADSAHQVTLGSGDDNLWITGRAQTAVRTVITNIDAGTGNDFVQIDQDHRMSVKLGEGADSLMLRAQDLQSNDTVQGGDNYMSDTVNDVDRIILTNETHNVFTGEVRDSETRHVFSIEEFWLLDSAIRLHITDNLVETAKDQKVLVDTTLAERGEFPIGLGLNYGNSATPRYQGMTYGEWDKVNPNATFIEDPNTNIVEADGIPGVSSGDRVYFVYRALDIPTQTVDLTKLNTVDYTFELRGGGLRDLVIVDEDALSQDLVLNFDAGGGSRSGAGDQFQGWSQTDTLQIIDGATVRAADLENVKELEIIDLVASSNIAQTWTIELNNHVINQPTGLTDLTVRIDPNVPANSKVYIVMSEDNTNLAQNNVVIERNSNVQIYISTDPGNPWASAVLVTEPQYNTQVANFNGSPFGVWVKTAMFFTENADNLPVGAPGDDTYIAQTVDHVQSADMVTGDGTRDVVQLNFAVAAQANSLQQQLNNVQLNHIEEIKFFTENNVMLTGIGAGFAPALAWVTTGLGNDNLLGIERDGLWFTLNEGNDHVAFAGDVQNGAQGTVVGGAGIDSVTGTAGDDTFSLGGVEWVSLGGEDDVVSFNAPGGNAGNTTVWGGTGNDRVNLDSDGTDLNDSVQGVVFTSDVETVMGGAGVDRISAQQSAGNLVIYGGSSGDVINAWGTSSTNISVWGEGGADIINVDTNGSAPFGGGGYGNSASVYVDGGTENDLINVGSASPAYVTVLGGTGVDTINVRANDGVWIEGGADKDYINVTVGGSFANVDTMAGGTVWGDYAVDGDTASAGGADEINVKFNDVGAVHGGGGNDTITVTSDGDSGAGAVTSIFGGYGSDVISVGTVDPSHAQVNPDARTLINAGGDSSNDTINLQYVNSNVDTIVFGNIVYAADQTTQTTNTQGLDAINGFNWEAPAPGPDTAAPGQEDVMDFSTFLVGAGIAVGYRDWKPAGPDGILDNVLAGGLGGGRSNVVVLAVDNQYGQADLANDIYLVGLGNPDGIQAQDGSRFVVITAKDPNQADGLVGFKKYDVYFVQDVDTEAGSAVWRVDLVAQVDSASYSGAITGLNSAQFINN